VRPSNPKRPITLKNVAEAAGVSLSAASAALNNGDERYSRKTMDRVRAIARQLGYHPNRAAQLIRRGRSNLIGVIYFGSAYEVTRQNARLIPAAIQAQGYDMLVIDLSWQGSNYQRAIEQLIEAQVEGVIIAQATVPFTSLEIGLLERAGIPAVSIGGKDEWGIPIIYSDIEQGLRDMTLHLTGLGHQSLLLLATTYDDRSTHSRVNGFTRGIHEAGGTIDQSENRRDWFESLPTGSAPTGRIERIEDHPGEPVYYFTRALLNEPALPDAIVCSNDHWARQVFSALLEAGLSVPRDVAVTGIDHEVFGAYPPYYLTTLAQPRAAQCEKAVEILVAMIDKHPVAQQSHGFPCELIIRSSCGASEPPAPVRPAASSRRTRLSRKERSGFTLAELLVALLIIGILSVLLFSGLASYREKGNDVGCINKLRVIGAAIHSFSSENNGLLPTAKQNPRISLPAGNYRTWAVAILPHLGPITLSDNSRHREENARILKENSHFFRCPADKAFIADQDHAWSYGWNQACGNSPAGTPGTTDYPRMKMSAFSSPSRVFVVADAYHDPNGYNFGNANTDTSANAPASDAPGTHFRHPQPGKRLTHQEILNSPPRRNLLYLDGHVAKAHITNNDVWQPQLREQGFLN